MGVLGGWNLRVLSPPTASLGCLFGSEEEGAERLRRGLFPNGLKPEV
jgi:hypothetical protein